MKNSFKKKSRSRSLKRMVFFLNMKRVSLAPTDWRLLMGFSLLLVLHDFSFLKTLSLVARQ
jgi:hypothetical protein